jgi:hypothetical protein
MAQTTPGTERLGASFRDPSGFLFRRGDRLFRQINQTYASEYRKLMDSGLYARLTEAGLLAQHIESDEPPADSETAYKVIEPERVPFISYPYEWSFSELKDAALATLSIQDRALAAGMSLKDASAYNIQFLRGKPALIDTLSFETYPEGTPWVAYRQFCQHFLAPLALMARRDVRLGQLLRIYIDGVPLDLASRLLPPRTRLALGLLTHVHVHAGAQRRFAGQPVPSRLRMWKPSLLGLLSSLKSTVRGLAWTPCGTPWADYERTNSYSASAAAHKQALVREWSQRVRPQVTWDLGANAGAYSRLALAASKQTIAFDSDPSAVELNYLQAKANKEEGLLPLLIDLTNPSPAMGWANAERDSLAARGPADLVLALALIHHLAIANNLPLAQLAAFFAALGRWLVIEFVPKSDEQVQRLLTARADIFPGFTQEGFEQAFGVRFRLHESVQLQGSERRLYLMGAAPRT